MKTVRSERPKLFAVWALALLCGALLVLSSCGESGACVAHADILAACFDGKTSSTCKGASWTYYDGATCSSMGFTVQCPASMCKDCWCRP